MGARKRPVGGKALRTRAGTKPGIVMADHLKPVEHDQAFLPVELDVNGSALAQFRLGRGNDGQREEWGWPVGEVVPLINLARIDTMCVA